MAGFNVTTEVYSQEDEPSSIVMVRLDKSDSRCNVRLKSIVAEVYSLLTANDGKLAFKVSLAVGQL